MSIITWDHKPVVNAFHLAVLTEATPVSFESVDRSSYAGLLLKGRKKGNYYILNDLTLKWSFTIGRYVRRVEINTDFLV